MIEWLTDIGMWGLAIGVKLGLPVALIFGVGFSLHRRQPKGRLGGSRGKALYTGSRRGSLGQVRTERRHCWEARACPPEIRQGCQAFQRPEMPCWQAVKQGPGGCIQSQCLKCSLLLSR